ncbi:MAG: YfhO family protein [Desulfuromonadaceae bacterium]|nr:YfhO family protein [Desulfuromonadaceae bacterium]
MTERRKDFLYLAALLLLLILFFSKILLTDKIIRAPDIINEAYWWMKGYNDKSLAELYSFNLKASWDLLNNSGSTNEGGMSSMQFLLHLPLILHYFPAPSSVAWFIVLHLFFGAAGVYSCCRLIGTSRMAAFFAAVVFALCTENASLINAGHVMKIATISYAPWAFFCLEKGFLGKRLFWFMATAFVLAMQFFNTHWQIAYYSCLSVGAYGIIRSAGIIFSGNNNPSFPIRRLLSYNMALLAFFLTTVSISLLPLANWSKDTNRGVQSGANQGKGGLDRDEAMSWSMPPEEATSFVIPGFFGLSRQEAGPNPSNIKSYYWGRMIFTQTQSYLGLLPWLLAPLPLIFRRDKYTWLAVIGIVGGILFSMGKYTPFYNFLFDYLPGINRFRVPKMIMFIPVIAIGILSARGLDLLMDTETRATKTFHRYLAGISALPVLLFLLFVSLFAGQEILVRTFHEMLSTPTRYEQGSYLIGQRISNSILETGISAMLAAISALAIVFGSRIKRYTLLLPVILLFVYLADVWRVDNKFMFTVTTPDKSRNVKTPAIEFIKRVREQYRVLPLDGSDPMQYISNGIPVMYTSNAVQQQRWQTFLDNFSLNSVMPDLLNVKYLIYSSAQYSQEKAFLGEKFQPVFNSPDAAQLVLENRTVLPKAWLVPSIAVVKNPAERLAILQNPAFNPRTVALVESPPPTVLANPEQAVAFLQPGVAVPVYENERIVVTAAPTANALLLLGEKYSKGWRATTDGKPTEIVPANHILRGVYLTPGAHKVEFRFDPLPFKIGKYLTLASFALFAGMLVREWLIRRKRMSDEG